MSLMQAVEGKEVVVVCGAGGVGKTTTSAALALAAAAERRTIVVTIDPARRLAQALGLRDAGIGHVERRVELGETTGGSLHAAMLDMKTAWDDLVDRYSPTRAQAQHIKSNRLYRGVSERFVGSQGYMAMERLADLHERGDYDLIVIDTPPTRSALDFLEAPKRMTDFIGGSLLRWIARPYAAAGKLGLRAFNFTASPFLKIADRVLGSQVLEDLSELALDFQNLYEGFKERADEVLELLSSDRTGFVVVTTLEGPPLEEAGFFLDRLNSESLPLAGVVANKVVPLHFADGDPAATEAADAESLAEATGMDAGRIRQALEEARACLEDMRTLALRDRKNLEGLRGPAAAPVSAVPLLTHEIHDVAGLRELGRYVAGPGGSPPDGSPESKGSDGASDSGTLG